MTGVQTCALPISTVDVPEVAPSPALAMVGGMWPVEGRIVGLFADEATDHAALSRAREAVHAAGALPFVVAPRGGMLGGIPVQRTAHTAASIEFDAVIAMAGDRDPRTARLFDEAFRHGKAIGVATASEPLLADARIPADAPGVVVGDPEAVVAAVLDLLPAHRVWERWEAPLR